MSTDGIIYLVGGILAVIIVAVVLIAWRLSKPKKPPQHDAASRSRRNQ